MRGDGKVFVKPKKQLAIILPGAVLLTAAAAVAHGFVSAVRYAAIEFMRGQNVPVGPMRHFAAEADNMVLILWVVYGVLILGVLFWSWRVSFWVFGPVKRLERQLDAIAEGKEKFMSIKVREADAFYDLFERINRVMGRLKD